MKELQPADEIFCLQFENNAMRSVLFAGEAERWVRGFLPKQVEDEHALRYKLACNYTSGKDVIEVAGGCGYGSWMLANEGAAKSVWSADIDSDSVRYGSLRYPDAKISRVTKDVMELEFTKSFDVAVSFETVEHLKDAGGFLRKLSDALRDNGTLLISTPIAGKTTSTPHNRFHITEWSYEDFHKILLPHFRIQEVYLQSIEFKRSRIEQIGRRITNRPYKDPDPTPVKSNGALPSNVWRGYQIVVCRKI